jgi:predicted metal-dependent hydrolase
MPEKGPGEIHYGNRVQDLDQTRAWIAKKRQLFEIADTKEPVDEKVLRETAAILESIIEDISAQSELSHEVIGSASIAFEEKLKIIREKLRHIEDAKKMEEIKRNSDPGLTGRLRRVANKILRKK